METDPGLATDRRINPTSEVLPFPGASEVFFKQKDPPAMGGSAVYFVLLLILYIIRRGIAIGIKGSFLARMNVVKCRSNPPTLQMEKITA